MSVMTLGFAFDPFGRVALINKLRPDWQAGKLNGIGGHVDAGELPVQCMAREFFEETGVLISTPFWELVGQMHGQFGVVHVYTVQRPEVQNVQTTTDEDVNLYMISNMPTWRYRCIENIPALIELCRIPLSQPSNVRPSFVITY